MTARLALCLLLASLPAAALVYWLFFYEPPPPPQQYRIDVVCRVGMKRVEYGDARAAYRWMGLGGWTIEERNGTRTTHGAFVPCTKTETPI